jgi:hypothetical protein
MTVVWTPLSRRRTPDRSVNDKAAGTRLIRTKKWQTGIVGRANTPWSGRVPATIVRASERSGKPPVAGEQRAATWTWPVCAGTRRRHDLWSFGYGGQAANGPAMLARSTTWWESIACCANDGCTRKLARSSLLLRTALAPPQSRALAAVK